MTPRVRARLDTLIRAVCPIEGTSGSPPRIDFRPEATSQQRAAAQAVAEAFDPSEAAQLAWEADQNPDRKALRDAAAQAISDDDTYLALASPSNAQVVAQVRRLTQHDRAIIKRLIQVD